MWRDWLLRAAAGSPRQIQIMYGLRGERRLTEWEVPWLPGYENSRPVRIGNAAHNQLQLDIFGEVMDALHQARQGGLGANEAGWALQREFLLHLAQIWHEPDEGIWEVRSGREHFTYSKAMAWLAFDRAIQSAETYGLPGPVERWRDATRRASTTTSARAASMRELGSFVRAYGSKELDASLLLLPAIGFLPPNDPRIVATVEAIERRLMVDGLVLRYDSATASDGLPAGEGVFLACSFWLVDAYLMLGRRDEALRLFEHLLSLRNDVGLLSEQYDPRTRRLVGNFPQAFSHLALVNTASNLAHYAEAGRAALRAPRRRQSLHAAGRRLKSIDRRAPCPKECAPDRRIRRPISREERSAHRPSRAIGLCRAGCRRSSTFTGSSAIRCSFATWASRITIWSPRPASSTPGARLGLRQRRRPRAEARQDGAGSGLEAFPVGERQGRQHDRAEQLADDARRRLRRKFRRQRS